MKIKQVFEVTVSAEDENPKPLTELAVELYVAEHFELFGQNVAINAKQIGETVEEEA